MKEGILGKYEFTNKLLVTKSEPRKNVDKYYSVEISIEGLDFPFQFKIWNFDQKAMCILVKEGSDILYGLKVGDTLDMKYYSSDSVCPHKYRKTLIRDIIKNDQGRFKGHYLVDLDILKGSKYPFQNAINRMNEKEIGIGWKFYSSGNFKESICAFTKAIDSNPKHALAYFCRGVANFKTKNHQRGLTDIKVAAKYGHRKAQDFLKAKGFAY